MIVGFAGRKQVGKSTAAQVLCAVGFRRMSFADPMKKMVAVLLRGMGYSDVQIALYERHKEVVIPKVGTGMRQLLQTLGAEWGREMIHPDLWVLAAGERMESLAADGVHVVVEDVRFENEAAEIRARGGRIVHIVRDTGYVDDHASEAGIEIRMGDYLIHNDSPVEVFRERILAAAGFDSA